MKISEKGLALIKKHEGLRTEAYKCPAGIWTIGYGHTGKVKATDKITEAEAEQLLAEDAETAGKTVSTLVKKPLNQNQFDALVSFVFNLGCRNFAGSTLLRRINRNPQDNAIREEFARWVYSKGQRLDGLVKRRLDECELYFS